MSTEFRRKSREVALQVLFQKSFHKDVRASSLFESFLKNFSFDSETKNYALFLTTAVMDQEERINKIIIEKSDHWSLDRMAVIDRILLQIAVLELCFSGVGENPPKLVITDIIDLAKKYSSGESKKFINGILDAIYNDRALKKEGLS